MTRTRAATNGVPSRLVASTAAANSAESTSISRRPSTIQRQPHTAAIAKKTASGASASPALAWSTSDGATPIRSTDAHATTTGTRSARSRGSETRSAAMSSAAWRWIIWVSIAPMNRKPIASSAGSRSG